MLVERSSQGPGELAATVSAIQVVSSPYQETLSINGTIQAVQIMELVNELTGKITRLNLASGERVNEGQILIEIDHSEEQAQLLAEQATLDLQKKMLARFHVLQTEQGISDDIIDTAFKDVQVSESKVAVLESIISKKIIQAPFTADTGIHNLQLGQYLEQNAAITQLTGINEYTWVDFFVPQIYRALAIGETLSVALTEDPTVITKGSIVSVEPMLTREFRQRKYRARIPHSSAELAHNSLVRVHIPISAERQVIIVPSQAVVNNVLGHFVYLLKPDEQGQYRAHQQQVELGKRMGDGVIVNSGLEPGEHIANEGAFKLAPGMKAIADSLIEASQFEGS